MDLVTDGPQTRRKHETRAQKQTAVSADREHCLTSIDQFSVFVDLSASARESYIKVAINTRERVYKSTHVVDNDTTVHDVHTNTVTFSPSVLIKCSICLYHQTLTRTSRMAQENDSRHLTHSHNISSQQQLSECNKDYNYMFIHPYFVFHSQEIEL